LRERTDGSRAGKRRGCPGAGCRQDRAGRGVIRVDLERVGLHRGQIRTGLIPGVLRTGGGGRLGTDSGGREADASGDNDQDRQRARDQGLRVNRHADRSLKMTSQSAWMG